MSSMNDYLRSLQGYNQPAEAPMFNTSGGFQLPEGNSPQSMFRSSEIAGMPGADSLAGASGQSWLDSLKGFMPAGFLGSTDTNTNIKTDGWGGMAVGLANGLFSGYNGMKQYGLAKDAFNLQKDVAMANLNGAKQTTNTRYEDRQKARVASGSGYESVDAYMNKNRIV